MSGAERLGWLKSFLLQFCHRDKSLGLTGMFTQHFFHPNHVPPDAQLVAAFCKMACGFVSHFLMEGDAAWIGVGDTGIDIDNLLFF